MVGGCWTHCGQRERDTTFRRPRVVTWARGYLEPECQGFKKLNQILWLLFLPASVPPSVWSRLQGGRAGGFPQAASGEKPTWQHRGAAWHPATIPVAWSFQEQFPASLSSSAPGANHKAERGVGICVDLHFSHGSWPNSKTVPFSV